MPWFTVEYQIGPYMGTIDIRGSEDATDDTIIAQAWARLARLYGPLPQGVRYATIIAVDDNEEE